MRIFLVLLLTVFTAPPILLAAAEEKGECAAGDCDDGVYETDIDWDAWGRNVVKGEWDPVNRPPVPNDDPKRVRETNEFTLPELWVGGVNVATYRFDQPDQVKPMPPEGAEPYELYENFDISNRITGEEAWWDLLKYRNVLKSPIGSFYYDKIALKRWVPTLGIAIPRSFALRYASELTKTGNPKDEVKAIAELVPTTGHYVAKPSHQGGAMGVWLVSHDEETGTTHASVGVELIEARSFNVLAVANRLTEHLHSVGNLYESWTLFNVKPGIVIEERYSDLDNVWISPVEFNIFVIWGRVFASQLNIVHGENRWCIGFLSRDLEFHSNSHHTHPLDKGEMLEWLDWDHVVEIAERLGNHKDMIRVDIFAGLTAANAIKLKNATKEEKYGAIEYVFSEISFHPTTVWAIDGLREEAARLWMAGYKFGNYKLVPNTEVPDIFKETGQIPMDYGETMPDGSKEEL